MHNEPAQAVEQKTTRWTALHASGQTPESVPYPSWPHPTQPHWLSPCQPQDQGTGMQSTAWAPYNPPAASPESSLLFKAVFSPKYIHFNTPSGEG